MLDYYLRTKKSDLEFGNKNEMEVLPILIKFFNEPLKKTTDTYDTKDFVGLTLDFELKSRRIRHDQYPTALVGENKILSRDKSRDYYVVWKYTDGLFYLKYNKELWDTFTIEEYQRGCRADCNDTPKRTYHVPYRFLKKIEAY